MSKSKATHTTRCWCDRRPTFDPDFEFIDETGFECVACGANVYYTQTEDDSE